jgi:cellulose synthase/poly-beta-1,6-N-acetylglucosamine synthase-like glycosyltransferase
MTGPWTAAIVVPACNEEATIEACVAALRVACEQTRCIDSAWIVIVADACRDRTAVLARHALGSAGEVVECQVQSSGAARRIGVHRALERFAGRDPRRLWIANTDADTYVPADWLEVQLQYADQDFGGVAGIVRFDSRSEATPEAARLFESTYVVGADDSHTHVHGANVGVRADAYLAVDGWSRKALAEDHCLWARLRRDGWQLVASARSVVVTSARLRGRARGGFADTLRAKLEGVDAGVSANRVALDAGA